MTNLTVIKNETKTEKAEGTVRFLMLSVICTLVLVLSFAAFFRIENNLRALLVLTVGVALDTFVFANGYNGIKHK